uniref:Integrase catalytic domain-containing protein n=1 Tax=Tanacetum cinerariifolium TaxID=118510 RepID=A0A6L2JWE8_TANCI|nr:hypothetical protein [Tanacetum cinerariifolium]
MALGYQNPFYLKQAQQKQQSLYNGKVLLEKHDPPAVYDLEETLQLSQESRLNMKQLNKEIKLENYTNINHLLRVFVSQTAKSREELHFSNTSKTANVSKPISIPNEEFSDDTTTSVARKFLNKVKSTIVTLQRVVKQKMTLDIHNWSSSVHQEIYKIVKDEIFPIVNQVDGRLQNFKIQFLKEAAKFVRDFKSLAKEADESLAKHKALELEIKRLLKAIVNQDIMSVMQNNSVEDTSNLQTKLEHTKERFENYVIKKENEYAKLWNDWFLNKRSQPKGLPKIDETHTLSKPVTSNSIPTPQESKVMKNNKVIAPRMFRINPFKPSRKEKYVPNKVRSCIRKNPITVSQPHVITKKDVNSDSNGLSSIGVDNTAKTRRPQSRSNIKNDRVPSASKSSCSKNKEVEVEEHPRNLPPSKNKKHMPSVCNNVKLAIQNDKSKVVCAMCKQCLITANHDVCVLNNVNDMNSRGKKQKANVSNTKNQKKQKPKVMMPKKVGSNKRLASPKPSKPRSYLRWSPTRRLFDLKGKIIASSESESQYDCSNGDNACNANPPEPTIKRFPNSTSFLGRLSKFVYEVTPSSYGITSINGKRYVLMIVDDYSRYTWVHFLRLKDEAPENSKIKSLKNTLLVTPQQNGVVEQRNRTLVEAARTLLILSRASLFLWAEAIATACYTQNRSIIHRRFNKTPYELINSGKPDISFLHVFGPSVILRMIVKILGSLKIMETMNVTFDELLAMAFKQSSLKPRLQSMTSVQISSGLDLTYASSTITTQQLTKGEMDLLFEAMYDDYIGGQPSADPKTVLAAQAPQNVKEAMTDPALIESMQEELFQFKWLNVWVLVPAPDNITPLTLKWLFKSKRNEENTIIHNKTRLVVRGYCQEEGIDFEKSFAPALYGLKQAPRAWYEELSTFLLHNHFFKGTIDPTLFIRRFNDDILVSNYVLEILKKYGMETCDPVETPMEIKDKLDLDRNGTLVDATKYRSMIGALMYLTSSRPDIVHATCLCARYQAKPTEKHLREVKRIFCYLRGTVNTSLWNTKNFGFELTGFSDADYA